MSPKKKKIKLMSSSTNNNLKRENTSADSSSKRLKAEKNEEEELQVKKRKNFVAACEQVSYKQYFDHRARLLLIYLPPSLTKSLSKDSEDKIAIKEMPSRAEELFKVDLSTNNWYEALEICHLSVTPTEYLRANVLKEIVEIMLNAHDDIHSDHSIIDILEKCQQILAMHFTIHPPTLLKGIRKCYNDFLISPMDPKDKTFTNRTKYDHDKGIVKYCMNRLEYEISLESINEPLVNKYENIPEEMRESVKGLYWQKEKFEIYELLDRNNRIERLMLVLESVIELLQFDLAFWHSRYTSNQGTHIMRSHKPLMAFILWSNNVLYTGAVNNNCRQILRIFVKVVHLKYPEAYIRTMKFWLNTVIQTFYICETNTNSDYPNIGKYCTTFANDFYKIISEMPPESIPNILENIEPTFMRYLVGKLHLKKVLSTEEDCIIKCVNKFTKNMLWKNYPEGNTVINLPKMLPKGEKRKLQYLEKLFKSWKTMPVVEVVKMKDYPKFDPNCNSNFEISSSYIIHILYITLKAYLDAYSVQHVQETLNNLNEQLHNDKMEVDNFEPEHHSYTVTEQFIKKYRSIYQRLKELVVLLQELKSKNELPDTYKIFETIDLLEL